MTRNFVPILSTAAFAAFAEPRPASAQDSPSHKLAPMNECQLQLPGDPQISTDGEIIVYFR